MTAHWMRPDLPQGFNDRQVFALFDRVAHQHWLLMPEHGLPNGARALALRALGQYLTLKLTGNYNAKLYGGRRIVAPFANAVGRTKVWKEGRL